jgi:hypothetical protein
MSLQIIEFKCQWVKHPHGIVVDEYGFTIVEPWVLASTVLQVFYVVETINYLYLLFQLIIFLFDNIYSNLRDNI